MATDIIKWMANEFCKDLGNDDPQQTMLKDLKHNPDRATQIFHEWAVEERLFQKYAELTGEQIPTFKNFTEKRNYFRKVVAYMRTTLLVVELATIE